ncbi:hypothetical protein BDV96DRAFT_66118 [Lophiotrema nucula]|uniref:REJ domain-containing protein n=1 Tax=Lophiotrema nucula TaxID=690887 RepID=A0A6A5Z836_9PLEO|nr:hypothetical protein BDV96DRAFT_66118 [Lophiotrema nucula]
MRSARHGALQFPTFLLLPRRCCGSLLPPSISFHSPRVSSSVHLHHAVAQLPSLLPSPSLELVCISTAVLMEL